MDSLNRFFTMAAGLIITASLIFVAFRMADIGKDMGNQAINRLVELNTEWKESGVLQYDGRKISGSDVVNFMKLNLPDGQQSGTNNMRVVVETEVITVYRDKSDVADAMDVSHSSYINPMSEFVGTINRNDNGVIVEAVFTQQ